MTNAPHTNPMNTNPSEPDTTTPADLLDLEQALSASALASRAGASRDRLDRVARASWLGAEPASAPAPLAFTPAAQPFFTPLRMAAMLAIGAGVLASVVALRTSPAARSRLIARTTTPSLAAPQTATFATADAKELELFDLYLASADESRSVIDAFTEDASNLQDQFDSLSTGDDWLPTDSSAGATQGAS